MEPENNTPHVEEETSDHLKTSTPLSKYLAMALFVLLPFLGGWIGYTVAPEKVIEVERVIVKEVFVSEKEDNEVAALLDDAEESRGIFVSAPQPNELVQLPISVTGVVSGDGWFGNEGEVGSVELFDANGKSISNIAILKATSDWLVLPTSFQTMVGDREMTSYLETDTGYLKFTNKRDREEDTPEEFVVPVRFK